MRPGKIYTTLIMMAIAAAVAVYFGFYVFNTFNDPYTTTFAYAYTVNDSSTADGVLVRDELLLEGRPGILDVVRAEGEKVGAGQTVALVYRDSQAQDDQAALESLAAEIQLLEYAVSQGGDVESAAGLDEEILQAMVSLRASAALGDYNELEGQVMTVKSSMLKRGYTYGDGLTAAGLSAQLRQLKQQYSELRQRAASDTTRITAPRSGTFSSLVDGYEALLTPQSVFQLSPSSLSALMDGGAGVDGSAPGKLILGHNWYFAALLPAGSAQRLRDGETHTLRFTGDFTQDVDMLVAQIGPTEGDETLVVFSSDRYLSRTTLLRRQQAELIFEDFTGLRVPKQALHLEKETVEDKETGQVTEKGRLGAYALVSGRVEFKDVEVVVEGGDYYVVRPAGTGRKILRAGDEIIVQGTGLYSGQLLEY